jgi:hypothetical protein
MPQFIHNQKSTLELHFPIMLKVMTDEETKKYHRRKLFELSLKSLGQIPLLDDPSEDQLEWVNRRMHGSARSWETWDQ